MVSQVKRIHVVTRENPIVNRLNKTKVEKFPDLREEKEVRLRELRKRDQGARDARVSPDSRLHALFFRFPYPHSYPVTSTHAHRVVRASVLWLVEA